jgi:hypothetical protein
VNTVETWLINEYGEFYESIDTLESQVSDPSLWRCNLCSAGVVEVVPSEGESLRESLRTLLDAGDPDALRDKVLALLSEGEAAAKPVDAGKERLEVYVLSFAPSYERASTGGFDWFWDPSSLYSCLSRLLDRAKPTTDDLFAHDYRICTLRFPPDATEEEIETFLNSYDGATELTSPPEPSREVVDYFNAWRKRGEKGSGE